MQCNSLRYTVPHCTVSLTVSVSIRKVADPWGGSYMMESLTEKLAEEAMVIIEEVRKANYTGC